MNLEKIEIEEKGYPKTVDAIRVNGKYYIITGRLFKMAVINDEWHQDVESPLVIIDVLKNMNTKPDIFTFKQSLLAPQPTYHFYMEQEAVAALPIISYDHWLEKQVPASTRKNVRKAARRGVDIKVVTLDDKLVEGIVGIYNETPVRRGMPFWHYQKDFEAVKKGMLLEAENSDFICAYFNEELIGFIKLMYRGELAHPVQLLSKISHHDKFPVNSLIAKAVEICAAKGKKYITYTAWRRGSHAEFLMRNGFIKVELPRYYIPLTVKGKMILSFKLHKRLKERIPEKIKIILINLRNYWYTNLSKGKFLSN